MSDLRVGALCAGYGGLELGLAAAGVGHVLSWYAEIGDAASVVMASHYSAPNLGDLCRITDPPQVDVVTAGFPCQPVSAAGHQKGVNDERWIIDDVCRIARAAGATTLILENVAGIFTANNGDALSHVCSSMASNGFGRWEWCAIRASDVGAPHQRKRWFCVATSDTQQGRRDGRTREAGRGEIERTAFGRTSETDRNAESIGRDPFTVERTRSDRRPSGQVGRPDSVAENADDEPRDERRFSTPRQTQSRRARSNTGRRDRTPATDTSGITLGVEQVQPGCQEAARVAADSGTAATATRGLRQRFGEYAEAIARWEPIVGRPAPDPAVNGRLNPVFVEWMMGIPEGWVTGCGLGHNPSLAVLGNGVVPQQAAAAIERLSGVER